MSAARQSCEHFSSMEVSPHGNQRIVWLDLLRGVGISLVVIGHCLSHGGLRTWVYSFHVPLLFMLSGYLNQLLHGGARRFRFKRVLIPYLVWTLLSAGFAGWYHTENSLFRVVNDIVPLTGFSSWNQPIWFLWTLLFVDLLKPKWNQLSGYIPILAFLAIPAGTRFLCPEVVNGFAWKNILLGCLYYGIGEMFARLSIVERLCSFNLIPIMLLLFGSLLGFYNGSISIYSCYYGRSIWLSLIASTFISVAVMALFRRFECNIPSFLGLLGKCSLFIMVSHYFPFRTFVNVVPGFIPFDNVYIQVAQGVLILNMYFAYFKLLGCLKVNDRLPDYLGGYKL